MKRSFLPGRLAFAAAVVILLCADRSTAQQESIGNLGLAWWQWAANFSSEDNPITQPTGPVDCSTGQPSNVLYLAGTFGGKVKRSCTTKAGKSVFFPIANALYWEPEDCVVNGVQLEGQACIDELRKKASEQIDPFKITSGNCQVDGEPCTHFGSVSRAQSDPLPFNITSQSWVHTDFSYAPGLRPHAISDGYWALLRPLDVGEHKIRFFAKSPGFSLDVTYDLTVSP
jgi:hypothetical protein